MLTTEERCLTPTHSLFWKLSCLLRSQRTALEVEVTVTVAADIYWSLRLCVKYHVKLPLHALYVIISPHSPITLFPTSQEAGLEWSSTFLRVS